MTTRVLFVCTGNVCRSPSAEVLLRRWTDEAQLSVSSAGMHALVGEPVDPPTAAALVERGADPSRHRARQFVPEMARDADLVLTAEAAHRDHVMVEAPAAFRRTFTMREFARLIDGFEGGTPAEAIAFAAAARGADGEVDADADDITDPFGGPLPRARAILDEVATAVWATAAGLGLRRRPPRPTPQGRPVPGRRPRPSKS